MSTKRTYGDACGIAHALDLVGERWALLVVRELLFGPKRYTDLRRSLPAASPNIVSQRLDELEQVGVVQRRRLAPPAGAWVYELTPWGRELEPMLIAIGNWALRSPLLDPDGSLSVVSAVLTLRTYFDSARHADWTASFDLRFGEEHFTVQIESGHLSIVRDQPAAPDAMIDTDAKTFVALLAGRHTTADAIAGGSLSASGNRAAVDRLFGSVAMP
jgi:DNA-binding HxlR family transcriptional regulator